jgi:hypothetical protein
VLSTNLGLTVVSNAATQILMRQSTQAIDAVTEAFGLTGGEARLLLSAGRGEGLLVAGRSRVPFRSRASGSEHVLASTGLEFDESDDISQRTQGPAPAPKRGRTPGFNLMTGGLLGCRIRTKDRTCRTLPPPYASRSCHQGTHK